MVEMKEVSHILCNATKNSLILLDEIGRGTSTYDGMSIARAVVEYLNSKVHAYTLLLLIITNFQIWQQKMNISKLYGYR